ncbi:hypothetical protein HHK36_013675 [Tetracentron sinense]|uniref:non-specific serine/threonine protein kinase n=1 Tax=Tetracentron sinense TaxID=13715 RepID=A0A834Z6P3_TETSI|nr:hypothetical protein HHK36_013675 [Tetracentron sinense]
MDDIIATRGFSERILYFLREFRYLELMVFATNIGKYQLGRTIGEGTFAKVKLAVNSVNGQYVAVKIIDKQMVMENKLMYQVKREISTMKLLYHPNIVRIHEVIASKSKIYIVMEYISGGQLSDKLSYLKRLSEKEARKYFQQLIDAVDYCHSRGVYHRDLKPDNLLLDGKGNLKVSDFGLSTLRKPGDLLTTACGSPSYVAPEVIASKNYDGAAADVWSCGVILFELLAGDLPFDDRNLMSLYRKISRAEYKCPEWFTANQRKLIFGILDPTPIRRMTVTKILDDEWFRINYEPSAGIECKKDINLDDVNAAFDGIEGNTTETSIPKSPSFINAFQLIAMSNDLDLSGLFEEEARSKHSINETIEKIEVAAKDVSLSVERMNNSKVIEVTPTHCVVEISKSAGELRVYKEFCKSLSSLLTEKSGDSSELHEPVEITINWKDAQIGCSKKEENNMDNKELIRGYSSS